MIPGVQMRIPAWFATLVLALLCAATVPACTITPALGDSIAVNGSEPQNPLVPSNTNENGGGRIVDRLFAGLRRSTRTAACTTRSPSPSRPPTSSTI